MYLDIVVDFQKRVVSSMDGVASRLHDQATDLTRMTRAMQQAREDQIDFRSDMGRRIDKVDDRFAAIDARFNAIDVRFDGIDARFNAIDVRFDEIDVRFKEVAARFNEVDARLTGIDARLEKAERENAGRFSAVGARFEEIEKSIDLLSREQREALSEIVAQNNQTINAVHAGLTVQIKLDEILERLVSLEQRLTGSDGAGPGA